MPPRRWIEYDTPLGPPIRRGHSFYGLAALFLSVIAVAAVVAVVRRWLPFALLPLAVPVAGFAGVGSLVACFAAALDQTTKQVFTWVGAAATGAIPLAGMLASDPVLQAIATFADAWLVR
jgi:hypothetical protein